MGDIGAGVTGCCHRGGGCGCQGRSVYRGPGVDSRAVLASQFLQCLKPTGKLDADVRKIGRGNFPSSYLARYMRDAGILPTQDASGVRATVALRAWCLTDQGRSSWAW